VKVPKKNSLVFLKSLVKDVERSEAEILMEGHFLWGKKLKYLFKTSK
jgi:hypothetical protein